MKHRTSKATFVKHKYADSHYVECYGVRTRQLTAQEIERLQEHVDRMSRGEVERPIRLEAR